MWRLIFEIVSLILSIIIGDKLYLLTILDILPFLNNNCSIHNYYDPTECTLSNLHYEVTDDKPQNSIGLPMANSIVFTFLEKVILGQIVIGGKF